MLAVANMSQVIPNHVLRVGQTVRLNASPRSTSSSPSHPNSTSPFSDPELEASLDNLNQLILELDPTFEPLPMTSPVNVSSNTEDSSPEEDLYRCVLVPRSCSPNASRSIPIPTPTSSASPRCSPHGSLIFSSSPSSSSRPPLLCGAAAAAAACGDGPSTHGDAFANAMSPRRTHSNRNSGNSMLSMSPGSDTSYMLGSCLSLASEDADSPDGLGTRTISGSFSNVSGTSCDTRTSPTKPSLLDHCQGLQGYGSHSSPASLAGSLMDIPVVLVNGVPTEPDPSRPVAPQSTPPKPSLPHGFQAHFHGSQPSMKFVMDTSKFWFRPHINRAEAEAMLKDRLPGVFVVRDSTSFRGSFGLVMKVDPYNVSPTGCHAGESSSGAMRHFLIETSAKGVRIKGSPHEPFFGSLSALVYQHTITACALPCKLLTHDLEEEEDESHDSTESDVKNKTASNFLFLNTVPTETLTGPCAVKKAVAATLEKHSKASITPTIVNFRVSQKGVTLTDVKRKLFFRRHYPAHLLSYSGADPDNRLWLKDGKSGARMFGFVAKGVEAGMENVCHVFAEHDPLQTCGEAIDVMQGSINKP
ncbi:LOW QUALITY PROTEIN: tensin-4-like [Gadus morhua]|uniref:LOW QUALITY PROTEIN: tensin-4-like n=1 Tax=Gadus morhua TaxID=8049 RepID=UPI0011B80121|nr:LOW QUALITY PROTEIN: tensin-4-like [Gadus morhua]